MVSMNNQMGRKKKTNSKGFSLVELLAAIVIVGILSFFAITAVNRYIKQSKEVKNDENVNNIKVAAQMYMQSNRSLLPKNIGESITIGVKDLRDTNYLKEDITNSNGESCMNSEVRIYHYDRDEYSYYVNMVCGDKKPDFGDDSVIPNPYIDLRLHNEKGGDVNTSDVRDTYFTATIKGSLEGETNLGIASYSYEIYVGFPQKDSEDVNFQLVESNENIPGGLKNEIKIQSKNTSEYVDLSGYSVVKVMVSAVNEQGKSAQETVMTKELKDSTDPICVKEKGSNFYFNEARDDSDWLNKVDYNNTNREQGARDFKLMVNCEDGNGSGCVRDSFVRTWPNGDKSPSEKVDYRYGARWSKITIQDNAKNDVDCYVRANIDIKAPSLYVSVYNVNSSGSRNQLVKSLKIEDNNPKTSKETEGTINTDDYKYYYKNGEAWLNASNYPNGTLLIDIDMEDNLYLYNYTWELNKPYLSAKASTSDVKKSISTSYAEAEYGGAVTHTYTSDEPKIPTNDDELKKVEVGTLGGSIHGLKISLEGKRYGKFKACDKAGNCTVLHIYANIDVTPPPLPKPSYVLNGSSTSYSPNTSSVVSTNKGWSNKYVRAYIPTSYARDNLTRTSVTAEISGFKDFYYYYSKQKTASSWNTASQTVLSGSGSGTYKYSYLISDQGTHHISFKSCDKAGNCTSKTSEDYVRVDTIAPSCSTSKSPNKSGWYNGTITVTGKCSDNGSLASGCAQASISRSYSSDINTSNAGPAGLNNKGTVKDNAGNSVSCGYVSLKIDMTPPTCSHNSFCSHYYYYTVCNSYGHCWRRKACDTMTFQLICSDRKVNGAISGCASPSIKSKKFDAYSSAGYRFDTTFYDIAGNKVGCNHYESNDETVIDRGPTGSCYVEGNQIKYDADSGSGVSSVEFRRNSNESFSSSPNVSYPACESNAKTYQPQIRVTNNLGSSKIINCSTVTVPSCCSSVYYQNGDCNATCVNSNGIGSAARIAYSNYDGSRCPNDDLANGGAECSIQCSQTVYMCRADCTHGNANPYLIDDVAWTWIHDSGSTESGSYNGTWLGHNSTLSVSGEFNGFYTSKTKMSVVDGSCGYFPDGHKYAGQKEWHGICGGWVYAACYSTDGSVAECATACPN